MASSNQTDGDFGFQIAPMIDIVFVLLLFFMAFATLRPIEGRLKATLASPGAVDPIDVPVSIAIHASGDVSVGGRVVSTAADAPLTGLRDWLQGTPAFQRPQTRVVLFPDAEVEHARVVRVMSVLHSQKMGSVSFGK